MKVKITRCRLESYWYYNSIGEVFEIVENNDGDYMVKSNEKGDYSIKFISKKDCEVLTTQ